MDKAGESIRLSTNAFGREDLDAALEVIRTEFAVDEVPLERGGPDYFVLAIALAYPLLVELGQDIVSSAIWDGIKLLLSKWRRKPSHHRPGQTVDLNNEVEIQDGELNHTATIPGSDPGSLEAALRDLADALRPYHHRGQPAQLYYDLAERRYRELPPDYDLEV